MKRRITELEQSLTECKHDKAKGMEASLKRIAELEAENEHLKACAALANDISDYNNRSI